MKKMGWMIFFLMFFSVGFVSAQENEADSCTVYISGSAEEVGVRFEAEVKDYNLSNGRLRIDVRNRDRNTDIDIRTVEVVGYVNVKDKNGRIIGKSEKTTTFSYKNIIFPASISNGRLLKNSSKQTITVNVPKTWDGVTSVTVYADACE